MLPNKHMGCKACDSENSPAMFPSAVAIGNQSLQNTIYPGMQGDGELSKGIPVNSFLAKLSGPPARRKKKLLLLGLFFWHGLELLIQCGRQILKDFYLLS